MSKKIWSLEEAKEILPLVRAITKEYYVLASKLADEIRNKPLSENILEEKEEELSQVIELWSKEILAIQVEVKGLWLVDFDNGNGYFCWTWGEEDILYEHGYHETFKARKLIGDMENTNDTD